MKKNIKIFLVSTCLVALLFSNILLVHATTLCNCTSGAWFKSPAQHLWVCRMMTCKRTWPVENHKWIYMGPDSQVCLPCGYRR